MEGKTVIAAMSLEKAKKLGIDSWSKWSCQPSTFSWRYISKETAYITEGDVIVIAYGEDTHVTPNSLVVFPQGMECVWTVNKTVGKVYKFCD